MKSAVAQICRTERPLEWRPEQVETMIKACREMALFHQQANPVVAHIYRQQQFDPMALRTNEDLQTIPAIGVSAMKHHLLTSLPHDQAILKLTSSGTGGQKTQIWFDEESLANVQAMLDGLWQQEGLVSTIPCNYLMFIYDPEQAKDLGIAFSIRNQQRFAPINHTTFAIRKDSYNQWQFERERCLKALEQYCQEGLPIRLCGIPSFMFDFIESLPKRILCPEGSRIITGGGWKTAENRRVSKAVFWARIADMLGLASDDIRDGFGMAEHSAPYMECKHHRFHVPVYNRVYAIDPVSGRSQPPGTAGLLKLVTPFNRMMPTLSLMTTDVGCMDIEPCPCGHPAPTFTLIGRGGKQKHKGCAITASELLRR